MAGNGKAEKPSAQVKRSNPSSFLGKQGSKWNFSDVPSDIVIDVEGACFTLHKAHPGLTDMERKKVCKLIDCQKLSQEAAAHAAQNERLPVQVVVQVLYFEQLRLRNALAGSYTDGEPTMAYTSQRISSGAPSAAMSPRDNYASLRRENRELKLEIARMRMRLNDLEKEQVCMKQGMEKSSSSNKFFSSLSKKFGRMNLFSHITSKGQDTPSNKAQTPDAKNLRRRRHSIS